MSARPAFAAGLSAGLGAWLGAAVLAGAVEQAWDTLLSKLQFFTAQRWLEISFLCVLAYSLAAIGTTTATFYAQLGRVSAALKRLGLLAGVHPPTVQDWYNVLHDTELEPLSNRMLALPCSPGSAPTRQLLIPAAPFDAFAARREIGARYARRLSTLQIWGAVAVLGIASALFLMGSASGLQTASPVILPWVPACATLALSLLLAAAFTLVTERADTLATAISRLPLTRGDPESPNVNFAGRLVAQHVEGHVTATELSNEIVELRVKLIDLLERQHQDIVAAMRHGLRDGLYPLSQLLMQSGNEAAKSDRGQIGAAIETAFGSLMDKIEERTAAPLAEARRLLEATSRAATSLSRAIARLRQDGIEHERTHSGRGAVLTEALRTQKSAEWSGVVEQLASSNRSVAEAHRSAIVELASTIKQGLDRLGVADAEARQEAAAQQQALRQEIEKLAGAVDALCGRLVPGLRRLAAVDEQLGAALDRYQSSATHSQALMEELAGLLEGVRPALERAADGSEHRGKQADMTLPSAAPGPASDVSLLRDELAALKSELETAERDQAADPTADRIQPPS